VARVARSKAGAARGGAYASRLVLKLSSLKGSFSNTPRTLGLVWRASPRATLGLAVLTVGAALIPLGVAWVGKAIMDAIVAGDGSAALRYILVELGLIVGQALVQRALGLIRALLGARLGIDINVQILEKALTLELRHFEDAEFYDQLTRARREASSRPVSVVNESFQLIQNGLTLAGYILLLVRFSGWAVLALAAAAVPATLVEMRYSTAAFRLRNWRSPDTRRLTYLEYVLANDNHAKEVKLFGLGPMLLARYKALAETFYREDRGLAVRRAIWAYLLSLLATGASYGIYVVMAIQAARGRMTIGDLTLYTVAFRQGQQAFQSILTAVGGMYEDNLYMSNLFKFLEIPTEAPRPLPAPAAVKEDDGIRFENVGFRYPGAEAWALRNLDVFIPKGQSLALVGHNGAGKTTFIKLLTRLYEPTEGRILLDGRDLRSWDFEALRARIGVIFQDFNEYQLKVRENVGVGSVGHMEDDLRLHRAVDSGGATEVVAGLKEGLDTALGRWFANGVELSGGQWQKIALARAFMREEADILVLDEPTAALDAEAEHAVFERFRQLTRGRTSILISHRFPTVRMADRIIVLEGGRIIETGTHAELVAAGARYAKLFALQAQGYQ
jgi:ATP-binding cassette subfamily B protein